MDNKILTSQTLDAVIRSGSGDAALLYLHILKNGRFSLSAAARDTGLSRERVSSAAAILRGLGVAVEDKPLESQEFPEYTAADIVVRAQRDASFDGLVGEVQRTLGKMLSTPDMKILFGIYDHIGLPAEVIMLLITHCIEDIQGRYGPGRMPTLRQIEKEAWYWAGQEIRSLEAAEEHIRREAQRKSLVSRTAEVLQIRGRELTPSERRYIETWLSYGFGPEELAIAYDRTVLGTGKLTWRYMDKIVTSWHEKGLHTAAEIESGDARYRKNPETAPAVPGGDSELEELRRLHAYLKNKEG